MNSIKIPRRSFLKGTAIAGVAALTLPEIALASAPNVKQKKTLLKNNSVILFQGDSITDAGRNKNETKPNHAGAMGSGYAFLASANLMASYPEKSLKIYNRGISGNKVYQLADRWERDTIEIQPDVLSILIGVNDFWHMMNGTYKGTLETYRNDYRNLLTLTKEKLPNVQLIIGEPFALKGTSVKPDWFPLFHDYRAAAREIANEFNATFIPFQQIFDKALELAPVSYWAPDGVHPSIAGAQLMAGSVLQAFRK
ncbi:secreted protein [Arcticibacter pallidicorallinus]|uniref:Secreted protein n=1 Tax=Arcticibacter pallidicorallinus TaxID=1259464 RepID=A0A2T0U3B1_9SPHI|nr:SGNH/GDSL hydrolase family protein [Arcticibacter pallidicorallinus]PRY52403.1 secreted protein [Arcticibacter pallidicorallinus]